MGSTGDHHKQKAVLVRLSDQERRRLDRLAKLTRRSLSQIIRDGILLVEKAERAAS